MRTAKRIRLSLAAMVVLLALAMTLATTTVLAAEPATRKAESTTRPAKPNHFTSKKDGFRITFPAGWRSGVFHPPVNVLFLDPPDKYSGRVGGNVLVISQHFTNGAKLDPYANAALADISQNLRKFRLISSTSATLGNNTAKRVVYEYTQGVFKVRVLSYLVAVGNQGYIVACTALTNEYADYERVFEDICKTFQTFKSDPPKPHTFTSTKDGFSITSPGSWEQRKKQGNTPVTFLESRANVSDTFRENINVTMADLPSGMGLDEYAKGGVGWMAKNMSQFKLVSSSKAKLGKNVARRIVFRHRNKAYDLKVLSYTIVKGGRAYILTCTATAAEYKKHEKVFEEVCKTFKTFKPATTASKEDKKDPTTISPDSL